MRTLFLIGVVLLVLVAIPGAVVFAADVFGYEAEINRFLEGSVGLSHHLAIGLPAAVLLFAVPPLIILLYFLRLKRRPIAVSSTYLWKKSIEDLHVNRLMQWLRRNVLLLLQLLAVLALIYAVLGPRLHGRNSEGKHYILIIDNSASMSASDVKPTRLDWAKDAALKEIDAATDSDTGMVIVFNGTAEILQSYTTNRDELRTAVRRIEPTQKPTRIDEALALAASLANPQKSTDNMSVAPADAEPGKERTYVQTEGIPAEVHLYSDGRFPSPDFALANLSLSLHVPPAEGDGVHSNNSGITRIDVERGWQKAPADDTADPGDNLPIPTDRDADDLSKLTVYVTVKNYRAAGAGPFKLRLEVYEDGDRLVKSYARTVKLTGKADQGAIGRTVCFYLSDVPEGADRSLKVMIEGAKDDFAADDVAWLTFGTVKKARVLIVAPTDNFLLRAYFDAPSTKALCDTTYLSSASLVNPDEYLTPAREGKYDLVIFDRCAPAKDDEMPAANTLFIGHPPPPYRLPAEPADSKTCIAMRGPTVQGWDDRHPLMANLRGLYEMGIDDSFKLPDLPEGARKLIEADRGHVLLLAVPRSAFTDLVLTFPLITRDNKWNTRWPLENSFVLFLRNVTLGLGNVRDASAEEPTLPGREKVLRPGAAKTLKITRPDGTTKTLERGNRPDFVYSDTGALGVYAAEWDGQTRRFAVNLMPTADHDEGDLAPVTEVTIGAQTITAGETRKTPRDLWKYVVLAGLVVVLLEWWIYNRRVQI